MNDGFFRVAACVPPVVVSDPQANVEAILMLAGKAASKGARLAVFPELCITGYTCGDLFHNQTLLEAACQGLETIRKASESIGCAMAVGMPVRKGAHLYNAAYIVAKGQVYGPTYKTYLPNYNEFYEQRLFSSGKGQTPCLYEIDGVKIGVEICEDLWAPIPPSCQLSLLGADVIVNLSASNDLIGKYAYLRNLIIQQSARCLGGYVYASAGVGESSTDVVYDGKAIIAENGTLLASNRRWGNAGECVIADLDIEALRRDRLHIGTFGACEQHHCAAGEVETEKLELPEATELGGHLLRIVKPRPFVPEDHGERRERCEEIINIQAAGLAQRLRATHGTHLVVGISGGLDSTLALLIAVRAFDILNLDRRGILGITMPGFGTTGRTHANALTLMRTLGVSSEEISIVKAVEQHFRDIGHDPVVKDVTYENCQARERTQILMDRANALGAMVLGTGDLSELALGWATYNGDHMSMYGVNASVPKTLVKYLVQWFADSASNEELSAALRDVIDTPISPELLPADDKGEIAQKTEDVVGPYELHDFFLYYTLRYGFTPKRILRLACEAFRVGEEDETYSRETIVRWMRTFYRRFFAQQFKRSCLPDGPKVGSVCLSPRGDWRMPSDASAQVWLREIEKL